MDVKAVYINTYKYDFQYAKICISSIRYWYPSIPIFLIKDMGAGKFDTSLVESKLNVAVYETHGKAFGWGFGKFEPLFKNDKEVFLFMDADTVMIGPLLDKVNGLDTQFVVDNEDLPIEKIISLYYDPKMIQDIYEKFEFPGYCFNSGQWIGTSGILKRADFDKLVTWNPKPTLKYPNIFKQADQGIFNFILHRKVIAGDLTIRRMPIMIWPDKGQADYVELDVIRKREDKYPMIIHWAGMKKRNLNDLPRADILVFFQDNYYSMVGDSYRKYDYLSSVYHYWEAWAKSLKKKFLNRNR